MNYLPAFGCATAPYRQSWVLLLSLPQLVGWGSLYYAYALIMVPLETELGLRRIDVAAAFSCSLLVEGIMAYPVGRLIDRGHERWVMTLGSLLAACGLWSLAQANDRFGLYLASCVLGVSMSMVLYTASFAVLTRRFPKHYRQAIVTLSWLGGLASTVFIPFVAWMVGLYGWRQSVEFLALLQLLVGIPVHFILLRSTINQPITTVVQKAQPKAGLMWPMLSAAYWRVAAFILLMTVVSAALPLHLISMLREFQLPETWAVLVPASLGIFQLIARVLLYFFEQRLDMHEANRLIPALIPSGILLLLTAALLPANLAIVPACAFVVLFGMGNGMLTIVKGTAMAQYVSREGAASLNGTIGLPLAIARAGSPLLLAALWGTTNSYLVGLVLLMLLSTLGVCALWQAQRRPDE
ncbi:MFS transporter [Rheinheimera sp. F8]|uniref:MFS transporter n=1 Tax=Rheinheimera sp. F8 TaxID=1763998 RepID=UPI000AC01BC5|nr:MFS transporter [Rheinheimera sp. F8]